MVEEYLQSPQYNIGTLKNFVYLLADDCRINYTIDDGNGSVHSVVPGTIYKLQGHSIVLTSEETMEGRFKFNNQVSIILQESSVSGLTTVLDNIIRNYYRVVVEDMKGQQYIMNIEFGASTKYNYEFNSSNISPNSCTITFSTDSNFPTLHLDTPIKNETNLLSIPCAYNTGQIKELKLCNYNQTYIVRNNTIFSGVYATGSGEDSPYKTIKFISNSFSFTEEFDGNNFTDILTFSIPLSEYKSYWQYNLIEFKQNKYVALFETLNGNVIASGYNNGYFPSYTITTSQNVSSLNTITITLTHISEQMFAYNGDSNMDNLINRDVTLMYTDVKPFYSGTKYYATTTCISPTQASYTLLQEMTVSGVKLPNYWVLDGHQNDFADSGLNIVGSYTLSSDLSGFNVVINDTNCSNYSSCRFIATPLKIYNFDYNNTSFSANIHSTCDWNISNKPSWLNISSMSGKADELTSITLSLGNTTDEQNDTFTIISGDQTYIVNVIYTPLVQWRKAEGEYTCVGNASYEVYYKYVSTNNIDWTKTDQTMQGSLISTNDSRCGNYEQIDSTHRWVIEDNKYICESDGTEPEPPTYKNTLKYSGDGYVYINGVETRLYNSQTSISFNDDIITLDFKRTNGTTQGSIYSVDFSGCDLSSMTSFKNMFYGCTGLASINWGATDTRNISDMSDMFNGCRSLTSLNLNQFSTPKLSKADRMFAGCEQLISLKICNFIGTVLTSATDFFTTYNENIKIETNVSFRNTIQSVAPPVTIYICGEDPTNPDDKTNILKYTTGVGNNFVYINGSDDATTLRNKLSASLIDGNKFQRRYWYGTETYFN